MVVDIATRTVVADLPGFPEATGVTAVPELHRVFVSVTGHWWSQAFFGGSIAVLNSHTLKIMARIPAGRFPDGSAFVPSVGRLFLSDETGRTETVIDTATNRRIATIPLHSGAGMTVYDPVSGHVLVNLQTLDAVAAIDPATDRIVARYRLPATCEHNHGLLLDVPQGMAFIACDGNARLLVMDLQSMQVRQVHRVGRDPDVLAIDSKRRRLYVASESGIVSVFRITQHGLIKLGQGYVGDDAHSVAVDPATGLVYLPIEALHGTPVLKIMRYRAASAAERGRWPRSAWPIVATMPSGQCLPTPSDRADDRRGSSHGQLAMVQITHRSILSMRKAET